LVLDYDLQPPVPSISFLERFGLFPQVMLIDERSMTKPDGDRGVHK
jgi:hypothetical protein